MPDELLTLRHKRALELLEKPGKKEHLEECAKKSSNCIKRLLAFIEYKESKAYKNGERPGSFGEILRTNSAGAGGRNSLNGEERRFENSSRVYTNKNDKTGKESSPLTPGVREQSDSTTCNSGKHRDKKF
ncbi:hypothetical protein RhiirC2_711670 [Rhizophagus irregularis]|uniref:Uncharacterized protein n=1 Tax=Rhizophagus irregularis TaxID=588596 RepID=A0A2N1N9Y0_9GLOM|nr:hypothetical protein RhiirC2_711670 [Rhizophagus irregularis]